MSACMSVCLRACSPEYLYVCLCTCLPVYQSVCLHACLLLQVVVCVVPYVLVCVLFSYTFLCIYVFLSVPMWKKSKRTYKNTSRHNQIVHLTQQLAQSTSGLFFFFTWQKTVCTLWMAACTRLRWWIFKEETAASSCRTPALTSSPWTSLADTSTTPTGMKSKS